MPFSLHIQAFCVDDSKCGDHFIIFRFKDKAKVFRFPPVVKLLIPQFMHYKSKYFIFISESDTKVFSLSLIIFCYVYVFVLWLSRKNHISQHSSTQRNRPVSRACQNLCFVMDLRRCSDTQKEVQLLPSRIDSRGFNVAAL